MPEPRSQVRQSSKNDMEPTDDALVKAIAYRFARLEEQREADAIRIREALEWRDRAEAERDHYRTALRWYADGGNDDGDRAKWALEGEDA